MLQGMIGPCPVGENTDGGAQAYTRRLNGIKMISCSNHFEEDVEGLTPVDQKYIWEYIYIYILSEVETRRTHVYDSGASYLGLYQRLSAQRGWCVT